MDVGEEERAVEHQHVLGEADSRAPVHIGDAVGAGGAVVRPQLGREPVMGCSEEELAVELARACDARPDLARSQVRDQGLLPRLGVVLPQLRPGLAGLAAEEDGPVVRPKLRRGQSARPRDGVVEHPHAQGRVGAPQLVPVDAIVGAEVDPVAQHRDVADVRAASPRVDVADERRGGGPELGQLFAVEPVVGDHQQRVVVDCEAALHTPPAGVAGERCGAGAVAQLEDPPDIGVTARVDSRVQQPRAVHQQPLNLRAHHRRRELRRADPGVVQVQAVEALDALLRQDDVRCASQDGHLRNDVLRPGRKQHHHLRAGRRGVGPELLVVVVVRPAVHMVVQGVAPTEGEVCGESRAGLRGVDVVNQLGRAAGEHAVQLRADGKVQGGARVQRAAHLHHAPDGLHVGVE
mmetsp:Transcript_19258/g.73725  ORF Transcript_19258/g.73725 Transcript_19258/m.73725 type:complete len:406 (-) Transcript_19258:845-2062(-)